MPENRDRWNVFQLGFPIQETAFPAIHMEIRAKLKRRRRPEERPMNCITVKLSYLTGESRPKLCNEVLGSF